MHLRGWGTKPDKDQAVKLWEAATRLLDPRTSFDAASSPKSGALLASYNLAMLHMGGHTKDRAPCATAVGLLKKVAEKGWPAQQVSWVVGGGYGAAVGSVAWRSAGSCGK